MRAVRLGATGPHVSALGFGTAAVSGVYGPADHEDALAAVRTALDAGVTLIDGGDFYGRGAGELLVGEALRGRRREEVILSIKYGGQVDPTGRFLGHDFSPNATKAALGYSLTRLGTDYIDVYRPSRGSHDIPIEETVGVLGELVDAGYIRHISLSEVGPEDIRRAHAVRPIADVQIEYSLLSRGAEDTIIPTCRELGIAVTAYGVLARGLLSGSWSADRQVGTGDIRAAQPRFQSENLARNLRLVDELRRVAQAHGATPAQLAIAWVASQGVDILPLVGGRRPAQLEEAFAAADIELAVDELADIERAIPRGAAAGGRYPDRVLAGLDPALR